MAAHWLVRHPVDKFATSIRIGFSDDDGRTWRLIFQAGESLTSDYSGFVALARTRGGFGAVYRASDRQIPRHQVALKLLHPEMTKDENLVARFRREGMVLCNLRDAHTITTYDFDQTPDGTLYIAMELLEGKSLHQIFHEEAPLEWKRVFKILTEMCSSLAEAH